MIRVEDQYFSFNRILLLAIGLWPHQQSKLVQLRFIFFSGIVTTAILFQFTTFLTSRCTPDLIIQVFSVTLLFVTFMIKYISFRINIENMKDLLIQLQHIYDQLKDKNEYAIVEQYGYTAKCYTVILTVLGISSICAIIILQNSSNIYDIVFPLNESRPRTMQFLTEYFVDPEKYFFLILFHMNVAICIGAMAMLAVGTILLAYVQHTCGIFRIASYRLERIVRINILENNSLKTKNLMFGIFCAVDIHRQAMKLSESVVSKFATMFLCLTASFVINLSLNLFRLSQFTSLDIAEISLPLISVIICIIYMFVSHYSGQMVTDHNNNIFIAAYNIQWYITPLHIQKMILFLLQRGAKDFNMQFGGLFVGSLECFATLIKASVSYFTVIYSTR